MGFVYLAIFFGIVGVGAGFLAGWLTPADSMPEILGVAGVGFGLWLGRNWK